MMTVLDAYLVPILIALLIGIVAGWWLFRHRRQGESGEAQRRPTAVEERREAAPPPPLPPPAPAPAAREDGPQGNSVADTMATAATDVAGDIVGVEARAELPGAIASPDNLTLLKGVGPKFAARLNELGITRFDQLAGLSENEVATMDEKMGPFRGRLKRDKVIEQAAYLARGDVDGFESKFGKLGSAG